MFLRSYCWELYLIPLGTLSFNSGEESKGPAPLPDSRLELSWSYIPEL